MLRRNGHAIKAVGRGRDALEIARHAAPDVGVVSLELPDMSGLDLLDALKRISPRTEIVVTTSRASVATAVPALNLGAFAYLTQPLEEPGRGTGLGLSTVYGIVKQPARRDQERALRVERPERKMPQRAKPEALNRRAAAQLARRARTVGSNSRYARKGAADS